MQKVTAQAGRWRVEEKSVYYRLAWAYLSLGGEKIKLARSILNSKVLEFVHKFLLDVVSNDFVIGVVQSDGLQSPGGMFQPREVK